MVRANVPKDLLKACEEWYGCLIKAKQQEILPEIEVTLLTQIPPNQQDESLLQSDATDECINPASMDPEAMHCQCYTKITKAGNCDWHTSVMARSTCIRCQLCASDAQGMWEKPLCAAWKDNACQKEHLGDNCTYAGAAQMIEQRAATTEQKARQAEKQDTLDGGVQSKIC